MSKRNKQHTSLNFNCLRFICFKWFLFFSDAERDRKVMIESNLLEHDHMIKSCIQLTSANVDRAAELMNSYRGIMTILSLISLLFRQNILICRNKIHEIHVEKTSDCRGNNEKTKTIRW